jgi:hypothetical protein
MFCLHAVLTFQSLDRYECTNGHPFTVGECGMPMEQVRCSECEAPVGGLNHIRAQGVVEAADLNTHFQNIRLADNP